MGGGVVVVYKTGEKVARVLRSGQEADSFY